MSYEAKNFRLYHEEQAEWCQAIICLLHWSKKFSIQNNTLRGL